ncbi:hypothetical protein ACHWQZ_G014406 [Mnemiopsis leidyi]
MVLIGATAANQAGSWTAVPQPYKQIDLETTPLEIKTDSAVEIGDYVKVLFYTSQGYIVGGVYLHLNSTLQYWMDWCGTSYTDFPTNPPADVNKVWRISITRTSGVRLQIHCNDVEVLNILMSDTTCSYRNWNTYWNKDIEKMYFDSSDTASDYYKLSHQDSWIPVKLEFNLETTPLEIKTDSSIGSGDYVKVFFYTSEGDNAGGVYLKFSSTLQYWIYRCSTSWTNFPTNPPADVNKVWRISITRTSGIRLQIHCNDVEVLDILMSDITCGSSSWSTYWNKDIEKMYFSKSDTAYEYYRPYLRPVCTGLKTNWTNTMETTTQFPVDQGTVVEITCTDDNVTLMGDSKVTCTLDRDFTYLNEPWCSENDFYNRKDRQKQGSDVQATCLQRKLLRSTDKVKLIIKKIPDEHISLSRRADRHTKTEIQIGTIRTRTVASELKMEF